MGYLEFETINAATGFANGDEFHSVGQVRDYFRVSNMREMFGGSAADQGTLDEMAQAVIDNGWHCSPMPGAVYVWAEHTSHREPVVDEYTLDARPALALSDDVLMYAESVSEAVSRAQEYLALNPPARPDYWRRVAEAVVEAYDVRR